MPSCPADPRLMLFFWLCLGFLQSSKTNCCLLHKQWSSSYPQFNPVRPCRPRLLTWVRIFLVSIGSNGEGKLPLRSLLFHLFDAITAVQFRSFVWRAFIFILEKRHRRISAASEGNKSRGHWLGHGYSYQWSCWKSFKKKDHLKPVYSRDPDIGTVGRQQSVDVSVHISTINKGCLFLYKYSKYVSEPKCSTCQEGNTII